MCERTWQQVWREGITPLLSTQELELLAKALGTGDARLIAGAVTMPPPLNVCKEWPVEACCPIGFPFAFKLCGEPLTVGEVAQKFARVCVEADSVFGEPGAVRHFITWWDSTPLDEARRALLREVKAEVTDRREWQRTRFTPRGTWRFDPGSFTYRRRHEPPRKQAGSPRGRGHLAPGLQSDH